MAMTQRKLHDAVLCGMALLLAAGLARPAPAQTHPDCAILDYAMGDLPAKGTLQGDYRDTAARDGACEVISEEQTGSTSTLLHRWQLAASGLAPFRFYLAAYQSAPTLDDKFIFSYSTDGSTFRDMLDITATADQARYYSYDLPAMEVRPGISVWIQVRDSRPDLGSVNHAIHIDEMFIGCIPPTEPWVLQHEFLNTFTTQTAALSNSLDFTLFSGGSIGAVADPSSPVQRVMPSGGGYQLVESSFGQMLPSSEPYSTFVDDYIRDSQELLYWEIAPPAFKNSAAFRYKALLYGPITSHSLMDTALGKRIAEQLAKEDPPIVRTQPGGDIRANFEDMNKRYSDPERILTHAALENMRKALKYAPLNLKLENAFLDVYYDKAVAEIQFVKQEQDTLAQYRLGFRLPPTNKFIMDVEIDQWTKMLGMYESAFHEYAGLFADTGGVDVRQLDASAPAGATLGWLVFKRLQPIRNLYASKFIDPNDGLLKSVPDYDPSTGNMTVTLADRVLFSGFKDYVMVLTLLRDYCKAAAELAKLYGMRGIKTPTQDDIQSAHEVIARVQQQVSVNSLLLQSMFPGYMPPPGDAAGVNAARYGLQSGLASLEQARAFLMGKTNVLGFDPKFLVLIQEYPDAGGDRFDSYDAMIKWISNSPTSPLPYARAKYDTAQANYFLYRGFADQVYNEANSITGSTADRYFQITGYDPPDPFIEVPAQHIINPKAGSELDQANSEMQMNDFRVEQMAVMKDTLTTHISNSEDYINRMSSGGEFVNRIATAYSTFGATKQKQWDKIAAWAGVTAGAQRAYDTIKDISSLATDAKLMGGPWVIGVAGAVNLTLQVAGAVETAKAQKELDIASADYGATLGQVDMDMNRQQAEMDLNDLNREQISSGIEYREAIFSQTQTVSRRTALLRELERLREQQESSLAGLHDRYYADPVHLERSQNSLILADDAFREAQRWAFMTARALEFKWNKPFLIDYLGRSWETASLFKLRNADELESYIAAIEEFNRVNLIGFNRESFVDKISLRDDVLARYAGTGIDKGWRVDTVTSQIVTSSELMRRKIKRTQDKFGNVVVNLDTFSLKKQNGFFFLGVEYNPDGSILQLGKSLDKIEWVKFNVLGSFTKTVHSADLIYGGVCYLRTRTPPCYNMANPRELNGEYEIFPFRYFRTLDNGLTWDSLSGQEDTVKLQFSSTSGEPDAGVPDSTLENTFLKERSVAATHWTLTIPAASINVDLVQDIEIYIKHNFITRENPNCN
ncbi:MAG: hypothetical protein NTX50_08545 [Candidatus Sumerlaeota bacterium]|nr:hypothetical protein [Candidatus Sumerlaeota bacterium]